MLEIKYVFKYKYHAPPYDLKLKSNCWKNWNSSSVGLAETEEDEVGLGLGIIHLLNY